MTQFPAKLKFRAEADYDFDALKSSAPEFTFQNDEGVYTVEVNSEEETEALLRRMASVVDGHRMWQTLDLADHYTGDFIDDTEAREDRVMGLLGDRRVAQEALDQMMFRIAEKDQPKPM